MGKKAIVDRNGQPVRVGTRVRVVSLPTGVIDAVEGSEVERLSSMVGEVFEVGEVDEYGSAWVTKWWHAGPDKSDAHSLALSSENMEVG
jgi:hypothetical protein